MDTKESLISTAKQLVKGHQTSHNKIVKLGTKFLSALWSAFHISKRIINDKDYRYLLLLQLVKYKNVHQTTPLTFMNRYPKIFSACQEYFEGKGDLKILSYGCSTGEEVLTLRRYFPTAQIIGADINKRSLETCRKLPVDEKISFIFSTPSEIQKHGKFDAIFCMAVLERKPHDVAAKGITNLSKIYPFEKFEKQIIELDNLLNPNGLLVVHFTQYSLLDTKLASNYQALGNHVQDDYLTPVFDRNSELRRNTNPQKSIFVKLNG
ncbi:class I SAM-dependent methyltransferase [Robertmurraya sp. FSL R5-0851]|uniref:class I SAM-dependent methyltransferase n=1 Tax=Robertmurraya sp. FSL R5-0851 TaxID=2921584 RepID=UPI0030F50406